MGKNWTREKAIQVRKEADAWRANPHNTHVLPDGTKTYRCMTDKEFRAAAGFRWRGANGDLWGPSCCKCEGILRTTAQHREMKEAEAMARKETLRQRNKKKNTRKKVVQKPILPQADGPATILEVTGVLITHGYASRDILTMADLADRLEGDNNEST
jgi:hypothetical protein